MFRFTVPIVLLAVASCGKPNPDYPPPATLPADLTDCDEAADCVLVELGCCEHCNGGTEVAVRVDQQAAVVETYSETCRGEVACTLLGCEATVAECIENTCTATILPTSL